jgi:phospho-N-acetylmuramoyl-pentapeptide-transferase
MAKFDFTFNITKALFFAGMTAFISLFFAPFLVNFLNKIKFFKKKPREKAISGERATVFQNLHKEREVSVPRGGGLLIWLSVSFVIFFVFFLAKITDIWWLKKLNFLSRKETWLPLFALISASIVGLIDDILTVYGRGKYVGGGMGFWRRFLIVSLIGLIGGCWFYFKLNWDTIHVPLFFDFPAGINIKIGPLIIPLFVLVTLACWSGGIVDGLDGLAGGVFGSIFGALSILAFSQQKADLATFCAAIVGALFAFLWYNVPPARFYMGETGVMGLTTTLAVVSFLTDSVLVLPIIAGILVIEVGSVILQLLSKKIRRKKIWLCTPIHHHFEAKGWPQYQVTMRFWILSIVFAILGVAIRLLR